MSLLPDTDRILLGPGPSLAAPRVMRAMASPTLSHLLDEFNIEIGSALGDLKGRAWRIGLMGYNSRPTVVLQFLAALEQCLQGQGVKGAPGRGVAAANVVYTKKEE